MTSFGSSGEPTFTVNAPPAPVTVKSSGVYVDVAAFHLNDITSAPAAGPTIAEDDQSVSAAFGPRNSYLTLPEYDVVVTPPGQVVPKLVVEQLAHDSEGPHVPVASQRRRVVVVRHSLAPGAHLPGSGTQRALPVTTAHCA